MERAVEEASPTRQSGRERVKTPKGRGLERTMHYRKPVEGHPLGTLNQRDRQAGDQDDSYESETEDPVQEATIIVAPGAPQSNRTTISTQLKHRIAAAKSRAPTAKTTERPAK